MTNENYDLFITQDGSITFVDSQGRLAELEEPEQDVVTPPYEDWQPTPRQAQYIEMIENTNQSYGRSEYELALEYDEKALSLGKEYLEKYMSNEIDGNTLQSKLYTLGFFDNMI